MIIVVEGSDASGKTTLVNKLSEQLNIEVVHGSSFEQAQCPQEQLYAKFLSMIINNKNIILDRYIYSNLVYASLFKDFAIISKEQQNKLEQMLRDLHNAKVYYLYADKEIIKQRLKERGDEYVNEDKVESILNKYNEVIENSTLDIKRIDTGKYNSDEIAEQIIDDLREEYGE